MVIIVFSEGHNQITKSHVIFSCWNPHMFTCSSCTFFLLVGCRQSVSPTPHGSFTCDSVSSPGRPHKQTAENFKLLRVPWIFENNIRNVVRCLLELDFDYTTGLQQAKLNIGSFDNKLRQVYSLWRRRVQAQKPTGTWT